MSDQQNISQPIFLTGGDKETTGNIEIHTLSKTYRTLRAAGYGFIALLITMFSIAVPLLHFILVPLGLLMTLAVTINTFSKRSIILGGSGSCSFCGEQISFVKRSEKYPFLERCDSCSQENKVSKQ